MDLMSCLATLSDADLEAVTANRPEAAELRSRARSRLPQLATHLGQAYAIDRAACQLDRFHLRLLQLACVLGGRLDREAAAAQGVSAGALEPAARELAHRGLAFPDPGAGGLVVPSEVQAAISYRRLIGAPLRPLLEAETAEELKRLAQAIGAPTGRKAELVEAIVGRLSSPDFVRALLRQAPPESRRALEAIRRAGGMAGIYSLREELGAGVHEFRSAWRRQRARDESGLVWLWSRGLVFRDRWEATVLVPAVVEVAVRGRAFPSWETAPPELELAPVAFDRTPLALVEEVSRLIQSLMRTEMPMRKSGGIGARECRRLASETGLDEASVRRLLELAWCAGLLRVRVEEARSGRRRSRRDPADETRFLTVAAEGRAWAATEPAAAWFRIFDAWRGRGFRLVSEEVPAAAGDDRVLRAIAEVPAGRGATVESLGRRLSWLLPAVWPDDDSAAAAVTVIRSVLATLGVSPATGAVGLSEAGRAACDGAGVEKIRALLPSGVETCVVQADMTVVVAGPPSVALGAGLARCADLGASGPARVYRLSEQSVARALNQGVSGEEIERFLDMRSTGGLPGPVRELVRDLGRRHGRLRVGAPAVTIASDDPAVLAEALSSRAVRGLGARLLAPTVAVIEGRSQAQVVERLRKAGLLPAVEPSAIGPEEPAEPPTSRQQRRAVTDPEVLERRRRALALAREARLRRLNGA
jgi:hypothetical protein